MDQDWLGGGDGLDSGTAGNTRSCWRPRLSKSARSIAGESIHNATRPRRLGARQEAEHHSAPVVMSEFMENCPNLSFTENQEDAEFVLKTQPGSSTLSNVKGDILYISPAKTLANMVKNVCTFIAAH